MSQLPEIIRDFERVSPEVVAKAKTFQAAILASHSFMSERLSGISALNFPIAFFTSLTKGTCTRTVFEIDEGSISI